MKNVKKNIEDHKYTIHEVDISCPEGENAWLKRQASIGKIIDTVKFGGVTVEKKGKNKLMKDIKLTVVIPAYNEVENLRLGSLIAVYKYLENQNYNWEVLIVDDGSTDATVKLIEEEIKDKKGFRLIKNPHGGKAITVMSGLLESAGEIVLFTDMDQSTSIDQIEKFFPKFDEGFDIVIGSRHGRSGAPALRKLMGWGFSLLRGLMLGLPFVDTQCGFKAFNRKSIQVIFPDLLKSWGKMKATGAAVNAGFDVETLFIARKKGFKIIEVPVEWHHVGTERVQAFNDSIEALKDIFRIKISDISGKYD